MHPFTFQGTTLQCKTNHHHQLDPLCSDKYLDIVCYHYDHYNYAHAQAAEIDANR